MTFDIILLWFSRPASAHQHCHARAPARDLHWIARCFMLMVTLGAVSKLGLQAHPQVCQILRRYDGVASVGSVETTVFQKLFLQLMQMPVEEVGQDIKQLSQHWANPIFLKRAFEGAFDGSNASCTTNCLAPLAKVIQDN